MPFVARESGCMITRINSPSDMRNIIISILSIFFALLSASAYAQTGRGNIHALVVGVSKYAVPENDLQFPAKDAARMYGLLKGHTTPERITLITDENATRDNILDSASRLFAGTGAEDVAILYFSGHGYAGGLMAHDSIVGYSELKKIFKKVKARKIVFADACFSGAIRDDDPTVENARTAMGDQQVCLFLSSRSYQLSWGADNGLFTFHLLAGLRGGADADRNRIITARELFEFVNPRVKEKSGDIQVPVMWGRFDDGMEILNWNKQ